MSELDKIWGEMEEYAGVLSGHRSIFFNGQSGLYTFGNKDDGVFKQKFQAILLYAPDYGRALWPDGQVFKGKKPLCQSDRASAPYDVAQLRAEGSDLATMHQMGWSGKCSTCRIPTDVCKVQQVAYVLDLHHLKDSGEACVSKLRAKGPSSTWNFKSCLNKLFALGRKEGKKITDYVIEFGCSKETGNGNGKVVFVAVGNASDEHRAIANVLAEEAYQAAIRRRTAAPALPASQPVAALPAERVDVVEVVDAEELF